MQWRMWIGCFCAALGLGAWSAATSAVEPPLPPAVSAMLRSSGLPLSSFGIDVRAVESDAPAAWLALNAEQSFLLASTTKLVTSLAALDLLGRERRWRTEAFATGPVAAGRLAGDLVIVGGDVGLTPAELRRWFRQMHAEGLDAVTGNIVLQHVALLHEADPVPVTALARATTTVTPTAMPAATSTAARNPAAAAATATSIATAVTATAPTETTTATSITIPITTATATATTPPPTPTPTPRAAPDPRTYNLGKLLVSVQPAPGERATVTVRPRPVNVHVVNDVFMGGGNCGAWARWKSADEVGNGPPLQLWVRGRWDASCGREDIAFVAPPADVRLAPELGTARIELTSKPASASVSMRTSASVPAPALAPRIVASLWLEAGGQLRGHVIETPQPAGGRRAIETSGRRWSSAISTPLPEVLREMNKTSNNAAARSLLLALANNVVAPGSAGALRSAQMRVQGWLRGQGLGDDDIHVAEGSGQSHVERGKPRALVQLLCNAWRSGSAQTFVDSLPIAGVDGTLAHRMRSGSAHGQAYLKTGTLADTRALAGYVRAKSGKVYAVTAIVTHPNATKGVPALDALIEWIASHG